ncbi:hypothetical protein AB7645_04695 [Bradyrhizobium sp. 956_D2_N1_5]
MLLESIGSGFAPGSATDFLVRFIAERTGGFEANDRRGDRPS